MKKISFASTLLFCFLATGLFVVARAEEGFEPADHFASERMMSAGGKIVSVKFEKDYTLVVLRIIDEDNVVVLPPKAALEKSGLHTDSLTPGKMLEVHGHPHKTNPLKILGETAKVLK